jgi:hypothetical protein
MCFRALIFNINARLKSPIEMLQSPDNAIKCRIFMTPFVSLWLPVLVSRNQILSTCVLLVIPSNTQVLLIGIYCLVMILITSWATIPPVRAEILCSSPPLARATSSAASTRRWFSEAPRTSLLTVARISDELAEGTCDVAFRDR